MYSVLIVDDEKMIREDVRGLLEMDASMDAELELDVMTAGCAADALAVLENGKVDIAILDINMPQMSGLELFEIVRERWPFCKVIFLTGYADFDYVYRVHKHAKYILKAEEDEKIIETVRECVDEIERELLLEAAVGLPTCREAAAVHERSLFFREIFGRNITSSALTDEERERMQIAVDFDRPVYYVLLRHPIWYCADFETQQEAAKSVYMLIERYFLDFMTGNFFEYNENYFVLLLQPKKLLRAESIVKMLVGTAELFLKALKKNLEREVSVLVGAGPLTVGELLAEFPGQLERMIRMSAGEIRAESASAGAVNQDAADGSLSEEEKQEARQLQWKLEYSLEGLEEENCLQLLDSLRNAMRGVRSMHDLFALEVYCTISSRLLGWIKRLNLYEELAFRVGIMNLYNVSFHANWQDAFGYLYHVTESLFALRNQSMEKQNSDVVDQVKTYIATHLDGDTSLTALADLVHFSREYLLRIFKKQEGITILQYINDLKLERAKKMLAETDFTVKEIAGRLGFVSTGYFGRFFRNKMGMTPNAYREVERRG